MWRSAAASNDLPPNLTICHQMWRPATESHDLSPDLTICRRIWRAASIHSDKLSPDLMRTMNENCKSFYVTSLHSRQWYVSRSFVELLTDYSPLQLSTWVSIQISTCSLMSDKHWCLLASTDNCIFSRSVIGVSNEWEHCARPETE